jgi:hypothetical protein
MSFHFQFSIFNCQLKYYLCTNNLKRKDMNTKLLLSIATLFLMCFIYSCSDTISTSDVETAPIIENEQPEELAGDELLMDEPSVEEAEEEIEPVTQSPDYGVRPDRGKPQNHEEESETPNNEQKPTKKPSEIENYEITLTVPQKIYTDKKGVMTVRIGDPEYKEKSSGNKKMAIDSTTVPASIGQYAKVEPIAPDFDVFPKKSECIPIHPSGSYADFILTPHEKTRGDLVVGARVELYEGEYCTGKMIPKSTRMLTVKVRVGGFWNQVSDIFRENFITFLSALLPLLAAIILFKIRKKSKIDEKKKKK